MRRAEVHHKTPPVNDTSDRRHLHQAQRAAHYTAVQLKYIIETLVHPLQHITTDFKRLNISTSVKRLAHSIRKSLTRQSQ